MIFKAGNIYSGSDGQVCVCTREMVATYGAPSKGTVRTRSKCLINLVDGGLWTSDTEKEHIQHGEWVDITTDFYESITHFHEVY